MIIEDSSLPGVTIDDMTISPEEACVLGTIPLIPEERDPDMGFVEDFINVYFIQNYNSLPVGLYGTGGTVFMESPSYFIGINETLVHEVGHTMGLNHTFSNYAPGQTLPASDDCLCKDPAAVNSITLEPHCENVQDCLCDTGMDPIALDLDDNTLADGPDRWVIDGKQIADLTPSIPDWCMDVTTPWDIPVTNFMSYYRKRNSFTPCQMALMHDILEINIPNFLKECDENDPYIFCEDILISEEIVWSNGSKEMCRNQEIIITKGGSLTFDDYVLTISPLPDAPSSECPDLVPTGLNTWRGIRLDNDLDPESDPDPA